MDELSHQEFCAVEKALTDLRGCYEARLKDYETKDDLISQAVKTTLHYAINIINLDLQLAELKFEYWGNNMAKAFEGDKNG